MHLSLSSIFTTFYLVALCNISVVRACGREDFEGVWHYVSQYSGTPWQVIIACQGEDCQYTETSYESNCNVIGYFTKDYIKEKNGKCTFGYNSEGLVIFEGLYEGSDGVCDFAKNGKFRGKGLLNKGVLELTFSDDKGKTFYNEGQERLAVKISK